MLKNLSKLKIEKRLSKSFTLVSLIASIAAVIGLIALIITTTQYSSALKNYGFTQGDIGKALVTFADTRAATRGIIAYQQKDLIDSTKTIHDAKKQKFLSIMTTVEENMTSDEESLRNTGHWKIRSSKQVLRQMQRAVLKLRRRNQVI